MNKEFLVVYNRRAGEGKTAIPKANLIKNSLDAGVCDLIDLEGVREIPPEIVIVGGDGTIANVVTWLTRHEEFPTLYLAGGGTGNTLRGLIKDKTEVALKKVRDNQRQEGKAFLCRFGRIEANGKPIQSFVTSVGFGEFEKTWAKNVEELRWQQIPLSLKAYRAGLSALWQNLKTRNFSETFILDVYSPKETVGPFRVFDARKVNLENPLIGLAGIKDQNPQAALAKLMLTFFCWRFGLKVPESVLSVSQSDVFFKTVASGTQINLDGNLTTVDGGELQLKKSNIPFRVAALKT